LANEHPTHLSPEELDAFRRQLTELRDRLLTRIGRLEREAIPRPSRAAESGWPGDNAEADQAWESILALSTLTNNRLLLHEVSQACERLSSNRFGLCVNDNAAIPKSLLDVTPWAKYCSSCATRRGVA